MKKMYYLTNVILNVEKTCTISSNYFKLTSKSGNYSECIEVTIFHTEFISLKLPFLKCPLNYKLGN